MDIDTQTDLLVAEAILYSDPNRACQEAGPVITAPLRDRKGAAPSARPSPSDRRTPVASFITFRTYGTWLHGDRRTSVDRHHNTFLEPPIDPNEELEAESARRMNHTAVKLGDAARTIMTRTVREVCDHRAWTIHALNVRTNHVHIVVTGEQTPERIMNDLKSWGTRRLREAGLSPQDGKQWSRHGSTRYLWQPEEIVDACDYVINKQDATGPDEQGPDAAERRE